MVIVVLSDFVLFPQALFLSTFLSYVLVWLSLPLFCQDWSSLRPSLFYFWILSMALTSNQMQVSLPELGTLGLSLACEELISLAETGARLMLCWSRCLCLVRWIHPSAPAVLLTWCPLAVLLEIPEARRGETIPGDLHHAACVTKHGNMMCGGCFTQSPSEGWGLQGLSPHPAKGLLSIFPALWICHNHVHRAGHI